MTLKFHYRKFQCHIMIHFKILFCKKQVHFSKDYRNRIWPLKQNSLHNHFENVESLTNLYRMAAESATMESTQSVHMDHIIDLLINFLKSHHPNSTVREQVIELVAIFQRTIQIKVKLFQQLKRMLLVIRALNIIPNGTMNRMYEQFVCLQKSTTCINLEMVAKRLASPKVWFYSFYTFV